MITRGLPSKHGYDLFKAAVTFILLLVVLIAVAINSGSTQAAEPRAEPQATQVPVGDIAPAITDADVSAGCIEASGSGSPNSELQVRSNDNILGSVDVSEVGVWAVTLCVDPGSYRLAAVAVNAAGEETNRSPSLVVLVPEPTAVPTPVPVVTEEFVPPPSPTAASEASVDGQDYIVQEGDWLMGLARVYYGEATRWEDIYNATNAKALEDSSYAVIDNPNELVPGWKIWIPLP